MIISSRNQNAIEIFVNNMELRKAAACEYTGVILDTELE
jgi:hypothetical protein